MFKSVPGRSDRAVRLCNSVCWSCAAKQAHLRRPFHFSLNQHVSTSAAEAARAEESSSGPEASEQPRTRNTAKKKLKSSHLLEEPPSTAIHGRVAALDRLGDEGEASNSADGPHADGLEHSLAKSFAALKEAKSTTKAATKKIDAKLLKQNTIPSTNAPPLDPPNTSKDERATETETNKEASNKPKVPHVKLLNEQNAHSRGKASRSSTKSKSKEGTGPAIAPTGDAQAQTSTPSRELKKSARARKRERKRKRIKAAKEKTGEATPASAFPTSSIAKPRFVRVSRKQIQKLKASRGSAVAIRKVLSDGGASRVRRMASRSGKEAAAAARSNALPWPNDNALDMETLEDTLKGMAREVMDEAVIHEPDSAAEATTTQSEGLEMDEQVWTVIRKENLSKYKDVSADDTGDIPLPDVVTATSGVEKASTSFPIERFHVEDIKLKAIEHKLGDVPKLAHGLNRVLFNRGVVQFRDLHSRVYNFDPEIEKVPPIDRIAFRALSSFTPPSQDTTLAQIARDNKLKYVGSTSSLTSLLKHMHYLLSNHKGLNFVGLSGTNKLPPRFTKISKAPAAVILRYRDGIYAVDSDKEFDTANVLSLLGQWLEKYLTSDKATLEKYKRGSEDIPVSTSPSNDAFHYSAVDNFLMRSQLDAQDDRLPGTGVFDLKTRAIFPIRMDSRNFEPGMDYELNSLQGEFWSYERELVDMARATLLKYMLQARIGRMDGIFVAYHNIVRIFGFQYISIKEMDALLHGQEDPRLGDGEFLASMRLLNILFARATKKFPGQSLRILVESPTTKASARLHFFAEPITDQEIEVIQNSNKEAAAKWEDEILGIDPNFDETFSPSEHSIFDTASEDMAKFRERARAIYDREQARLDAADAKALEDKIGEIGSTPPVNEAETTAAAEQPAAEQPAAEQPVAHDAAASAEASPNSTAESTDPIVADVIAGVAADSAPEPAEDQDSDSDLLIAEEDVPAPSKPFVAYVVHTKNNIDGVRHSGTPAEGLRPGQEWAVEYQIKEIVDEALARTLYARTAGRRRLLLDDPVQRLRAAKAKSDYFWSVLARLSRDARAWRSQRDFCDARDEDAVGGRVRLWDRAEPVRRADYEPLATSKA